MAAVMAPVVEGVPEVTVPMLWLMLPVPFVKVGVRVTVAPYNGVEVLAARLVATGAATTFTVALPITEAGVVAPLVTVQLRVSGPTAPAVKVIALVFVTLVMVPPLMVQAHEVGHARAVLARSQ